MTKRLPPKGDHQTDLFSANFADIPIRDQRDTMERPFSAWPKGRGLHPLSLWCGGMPVLGYDVDEHGKLIINETEHVENEPAHGGGRIVGERSAGRRSKGTSVAAGLSPRARCTNSSPTSPTWARFAISTSRTRKLAPEVNSSKPRDFQGFFAKNRSC